MGEAPLDEADLTEAVGMYSTLLGGGMAPEPARALLGRTFGEDAVPQILERFDWLQARIMQLGDPPTLVEGPRAKGWYVGPRPGDRHWPALKAELARRGWSQQDIDSLDRTSTRIVSLLPPPGAEQFAARGLVVGYVQSGKTTNFTAVIAKAADAGYKGFIVLAGMHNVLRNQTQKRLEADLESLNTQLWTKLTSRDVPPSNGRAGRSGDFSSAFPAGVDAFLTNLGQQRVLAVTKKNASRLRALRKWLTGGSPLVLQSCPFLVIDDEADQASLNTAADDERRTAINREILELLSVLPKSVYIGYTATPFANFFVDPSDLQQLYPRDFIVSLDRPAGYFGAERLFGRERLDTDEESPEIEGLDMIRLIPPDEVPLLRPASRIAAASFVPEITPTLKTALAYFWMSTAARRVRAGTGGRALHSTMLVHTTERVVVHARMCKRLEKERDEVLACLKADDQELLEIWKALWVAETGRVPAEDLGETPVSFEDLLPELKGVLEETAFVEENGQSLNRLSYEMPGQVVVVVGGNVLSRGLTLEGLTVSVFVRTTNTYDTLLQMGRWFGYRHGYSDLPRIWMTADLAENFRTLALVEHEIRNDIAKYEIEGVTPLTFAPRVRTHPSMAITSAMKMRHAEPCLVSFENSEPQTTAFSHRDARWLADNQEAAKALVADLVSAGVSRRQRDGNIIFLGAPAEMVTRFLSTYKAHERSLEFRPGEMAKYIQECNADGELLSWNVVFVGKRSGGPEFDFGHGVKTKLLNRARLRHLSNDSSASLGALLSAKERVADLDLPSEALVGLSDRKDYQKLRENHAPGTGLLLIYAIDKDSQGLPSNSRLREPLDAVDHVIGSVAIFPSSKRQKTVFMSVRLPGTDEPVEDEDVLVEEEE